MSKKFSIFTTFFLALTTMPFSAFAIRAHHDTGEVIFWARDTFCSENETGYGFNCSNEKPFSCNEYRSDWNSNHNLQIAWRYFNHLLKIACDDESGLMFSYVEDVDYDMFSDKIIAVKCLPGYKHPDSSVSNFQFKCIEDSRYSDEYRDEQYNKIMGLEQKTTTTATTPAITKTTPAPTPTPAVSKAGGATQKKVVTPPKQTTDARAKANAEYAEQLREPWKEYEAEENVLPAEANTNSSANAPYADVNSTVANPDYQAPHEHIDKLSAPTPTALAAPDIKSQNIKINEPAQLSDKDQKKMLEQQKKDTCENFVNGKYSVGACWCGTTKVTDMTKTCQQINEEKQAQKDADKAERDAKKQEKENKKTEEKAKKAEAEAKDKEKCENTIGGKYSVGACWCGTTKVTDMTKTCQQINEEKQAQKDADKAERDAKKQEKENKKAEEKAKKAEAEAKDKEKCENTIGGKYSVGACWCGTTKVTDQSKTCEQIKKEKSDKKDQAKIDKEAKNITSKANSLSIGDSLTYETALENELAVGEALSKWESKCEEKTLALAGGAEYDITTTTSGNKTTLTCLIKNCTADEYNVTTDKKSCTKNANGCADGDEKCNKKVAKAENKLEKELEKELEKDINTLSKEFLSVVKSITKTCENGGGSISENGECIVPETTEPNRARANGRSAGAKSRKR